MRHARLRFTSLVAKALSQGQSRASRITNCLPSLTKPKLQSQRMRILPSRLFPPSRGRQHVFHGAFDVVLYNVPALFLQSDICTTPVVLYVAAAIIDDMKHPGTQTCSK